MGTQVENTHKIRNLESGSNMQNEQEKKIYPKIPGSAKVPFEDCVAFVKYDGSNLHWQWQRGQWVQFGTRRKSYPYTKAGKKEFNRTHEMDKAHRAFEATGLHDMLAALFQSHFPNNNVMAFTEYVGDRSFAGGHEKGDDTMRLVLFDVSVDGEFLLPDRFLELFSHIPNVAQVVYRGKLDGSFVESVRNGDYNVDEGVVCKGSKRAWMAKIKTKGYMKKLKERHGEKWTDLWE